MLLLSTTTVSVDKLVMKLETMESKKVVLLSTITVSVDKHVMKLDTTVTKKVYCYQRLQSVLVNTVMKTANFGNQKRATVINDYSQC